MIPEPFNTFNYVKDIIVCPPAQDLMENRQHLYFYKKKTVLNIR
jgi:hypothetical protein